MTLFCFTFSRRPIQSSAYFTICLLLDKKVAKQKDYKTFKQGTGTMTLLVYVGEGGVWYGAPYWTILRTFTIRHKLFITKYLLCSLSYNHAKIYINMLYLLYILYGQCHITMPNQLIEHCKLLISYGMMHRALVTANSSPGLLRPTTPPF